MMGFFNDSVWFMIATNVASLIVGFAAGKAFQSNGKYGLLHSITRPQALLGLTVIAISVATVIQVTNVAANQRDSVRSRLRCTEEMASSIHQTMDYQRRFGDAVDTLMRRLHSYSYLQEGPAKPGSDRAMALNYAWESYRSKVQRIVEDQEDDDLTYPHCAQGS